MKNLYILLVFFISVAGFAQNPLDIENKLSPGGLLDNVFDQYGNKYNLSDLKVGADVKIKEGETSRSTPICSSGIFDLYFETGSGMEDTTDATHNARRAVVCQVYSDLSNFINSPLKNTGNTTRVKIWVRSMTNLPNVPANAIGLATSFYTMPNNTAANFGGIVDGEVYKTIQGGRDSYTNTIAPLMNTNGSGSSSGNFYHGMMAFSFTNFTWNTNTAVNAGVGQYDLYSVVLHEVTHALGFSSLLKYDGNSVFSNGYKYYSRYDRFLKNNGNTHFLITTAGACSMYDYSFSQDLTETVLHPNCSLTPPVASTSSNLTNCGTAIHFVGTETVPVYTPSCYEGGSSFSHFEDLCLAPNINDGYFVMSNAQDTGSFFTKRFLKPEERNALIDIGYSLNTNYGNNSIVANSFKDYGGTVPTGNNVAGINDGISSAGMYTFTGNSGAPISISGILSNDYNATSFECLQDVFSAATFSSTSGTSATTIQFTSNVGGLHLLRYVPVSADGKKGNITYIYVYVFSNNCTPASSCNLLKNGDFENSINCGQLYFYLNINDVRCWDLLSASPDLFKRNCSNENNGFKIPITPSLSVPPVPATDTWDSNPLNTSMLGLWEFPDPNNHTIEGIQTKLSSSILPNQKYVLSFKAKAQDNVVSIGTFKTKNVPVKLFFGGSTGLYASSSFSSVPVNIPELVSVVVPNNHQWNSFTVVFSGANVPLDYLSIFNNSTNVYESQLYGTYVLLDDISIMPLNGADFNLPASQCPGMILPNLSTYLSALPTNGVFAGPGVATEGGIYSFNATTAGVGTHTITYTYTNSSGCLVTISSNITVVSSAMIPTFNPIAPICSGSTLSALPTTSTNTIGITGTWLPALNNLATTTYTFTPDSGQCATTASLTITIQPTKPIDFDAIGPLCENCCVDYTLPTVSSNGVTGTWTPSVVDLSIIGTSIYTFTPDSDPEICYERIVMNISVISKQNPICSYGNQACFSELTLSYPEAPGFNHTYRSADWIKTNTNYLVSNQSIDLLAAVSVTLESGTYIKSGANFLARIENCPESKFKESPEVIENYNIDVYPNPTNSYVTASSSVSPIKSIVISSLDGKVVYINNTVNNKSYQFDMSGYQNGVYIFTTETADGKITRQKLIKN